MPKIKNEPGKVVVIVGDGAFTGGMVYEGMNNVSKLNNLIVILNDNKMSISKNVGQMANYLTKLRTDPKYFHAKAQMETVLERIPVVGDSMIRCLQGGKQFVRRGIYHSTMFEEMGFQYIGPVDGHDVIALEHMLNNLREQYAPIFLHVVTQKGKGLKPAEENPGEFHAVSSIDLNHLTNPELSPKDSFSTTFGSTLAELGKDEPRLCAITAAMKYGTGLNFFKHAHVDRFFDVGMAEEHAVSFAAGLASQGLLPVVAIYSTFFQRAYDQIIHDVNLMKLDVLFAVDRAGLVPGDGETHQGIYDTAFLARLEFRSMHRPTMKNCGSGCGILSRKPEARVPFAMPAGRKSPPLRRWAAAEKCSIALKNVRGLRWRWSVMVRRPKKLSLPATFCNRRTCRPIAISWCACIRCRTEFAKHCNSTIPFCLPRIPYVREALANSWALPCSSPDGKAAICCVVLIIPICFMPMCRSFAGTRAWMPRRWQRRCWHT